ncbi:ANTAR domain-containing protein [Marmoricola sp. URHB0036]|uniref:ANTAR domain-containing protein n=1 Tax=Marmoricola sp. URHB0036 TaxID=1298863 RepID=UPI0004834D79|nr:ANTAR domain-containing protein [Marmoricola sp. URHB0036]
MPRDDEQATDALGARAVIGRAVELLMARDGVSRDAAFELLVQRSSGSQAKVREIAAEVVEQESA